jgi:hypothetical protein
MEDIAPYALGRPALEAVVECLPRAIRRWRIDPTTAALDEMDDTADDPTVVHPRLAARVGGKVLLQLRKLRFRQK